MVIYLSHNPWALDGAAYCTLDGSRRDEPLARGRWPRLDAPSPDEVEARLARAEARRRELLSVVSEDALQLLLSVAVEGRSFAELARESQDRPHRSTVKRRYQRACDKVQRGLPPLGIA